MENNPVITIATSVSEGGKRGRPRGVMDVNARRRMQAEKNLKNRIYKFTDKLIGSQMVTALGTYRVVVPERSSSGTIIGFKTVHDIKKIEELLQNSEHGKDYMVLTGSMPDWKAANALLDRAYGKAKESVAVEGEIKFSLRDLAESRRTIDEEHIIEIDKPSITIQDILPVDLDPEKEISIDAPEMELP